MLWAMAATKPAWKPGSKQEAFAREVFTLSIERAAAKQILRDITTHGLTPELRRKAEEFLARHPD
jgi:hypothetical protein